MAKMSRNQLKSLIKECLVEVLVEGLVSGSEKNNLKESIKTKSPAKSQPRGRPGLDNIVYNDRDDKKKILRESVAACTSDPILADTALTTLQDQITENRATAHSHQVSVNGDSAAKMASGSDPLDMFGDAANNWAALAFNSVSNK